MESKIAYTIWFYKMWMSDFGNLKNKSHVALGVHMMMHGDVASPSVCYMHSLRGGQWFLGVVGPWHTMQQPVHNG